MRGRAQANVLESGLADLFRRIEIVSQKDAPPYARVLAEFDIAPAQFAMIGNSLPSDIAPVLELGGWACMCRSTHHLGA